MKYTSKELLFPPVGGEEGKGGPKGLHLVYPSPSQRLSLRGRCPSGAEPEPAATLTLPHREGEGMSIQLWPD